MLPNALHPPFSMVPSLRRTLSDFGTRPTAKEGADNMALHRRSDSTDLVLSDGVPTESSRELKSKLSLHGKALR